MNAPAFGYCRQCGKWLSADAVRCTHCELEDPIDRFEDLALGGVYSADYVGAVARELHWFRLKHSGRRVFAAVPGGAPVSPAFRAGGEGSGAHRLECCSFEGSYPTFRYLSGAG